MDFGCCRVVYRATMRDAPAALPQKTDYRCPSLTARIRPQKRIGLRPINLPIPLSLVGLGGKPLFSEEGLAALGASPFHVGNAVLSLRMEASLFALEVMDGASPQSPSKIRNEVLFPSASLRTDTINPDFAPFET